MNRSEFISFLEVHDCEIVRVANQGYSIMRNKNNGKQSGVPVNDPLKQATMCRICATLDIKPPREFEHADTFNKIFKER